MSTLSSAQVHALDPYAFLAVLGKRVIHPGGRASTDKLLTWADLKAGERVLDIGCGVGTTAVRLVREHDARVVAADLSPLMRERASRAVDAAGLVDRVDVAEADILDLPYADDSFDCVIAEAVTMFVDRPRAAAELVRVCQPGGRVLATESTGAARPLPRPKRSSSGRSARGCASTVSRSGSTSTDMLD
jgi:ubiquinone/menaquinone biosynthesis C-methylase UbiE